MSCTHCCHQGPETGGHLPLQPPNEHSGLESTGFLPPHHGHWGGLVMDHWEGFYYFISSRLWNDEPFSSGWCLVGLTGGAAVLPCAITGKVAVFNTWGYMVDGLKDRKEEELEYFQGCWPHSVANEGKLSLLITSSIFTPLEEITLNFILSPLTNFDIDKKCFLIAFGWTPLLADSCNQCYFLYRTWSGLLTFS